MMPARLTRLEMVLHAICTDNSGRSIPRNSGRSCTMSCRKRVRVTRPDDPPTDGAEGTLPLASAWSVAGAAPLLLAKFPAADPLPMLPTTGDPTVSSSYRLGDGSVVMGCTWRTVVLDVDVPAPVVGASCAAFKIPCEIGVGAKDEAVERLLSSSRVANVHDGSALLGRRRRRWALKLVLLVMVDASVI